MFVKVLQSLIPTNDIAKWENEDLSRLIPKWDKIDPMTRIKAVQISLIMLQTNQNDAIDELILPLAIETMPLVYGDGPMISNILKYARESKENVVTLLSAVVLACKIAEAENPTA